MCIPLSLFTPIVPFFPLTNLPFRNNFLKGDFYHAISSFSSFIALQKCASEFCSYCTTSGGLFFLTQGKS